jgi:segregation and condensation protein B
LLSRILEAALLAADQPLGTDRLLALFAEAERPTRDEVHAALEVLRGDCAQRAIELVEVAGGFRFQVRREFAERVSRLWEERPPRYSRALLETLALIAYRQPITRGEIEDIRGVGVSSSITKTLQEREWIRVVGHREVPGRPAMYGTTQRFLDDFNLKRLDELPTLAELRDLLQINVDLPLEDAPDPEDDAADGAAAVRGDSPEDDSPEGESPEGESEDEPGGAPGDDPLNDMEGKPGEEPSDAPAPVLADADRE